MGSDQQSSAASGHLRTARFAESAAEASGVDRTGWSYRATPRAGWLMESPIKMDDLEWSLSCLRKPRECENGWKMDSTWMNMDLQVKAIE